MSILERLEPHASVKTNVPLKKHTTYRIGGNADYFISPDNLEGLLETIRILNEENIDYLVLGKGSNVLFSDEPYHGAVISLERNFDHTKIDDTLVEAEAGASLIALAYQAMEHGLSGLEFASGIPGSVGGGLYMNAGAYKSDLAAILKQVLVLRNNRVEWIDPEELDYQYRHSAFQKHKDWIILAGRFQLEKGDKNDIEALMASRKKRRISTQPVSMPCAGSVFRNPEGNSAWKIIDAMGYRGKQMGGARVSDKHSNFIVNEKDATAKDVNDLIEAIQKDAKNQFGVDLVTEVERLNWK